MYPRFRTVRYRPSLHINAKIGPDLLRELGNVEAATASEPDVAGLGNKAVDRHATVGLPGQQAQRRWGIGSARVIICHFSRVRRIAQVDDPNARAHEAEHAERHASPGVVHDCIVMKPVGARSVGLRLCRVFKASRPLKERGAFNPVTIVSERLVEMANGIAVPRRVHGQGFVEYRHVDPILDDGICQSVHPSRQRISR